MKAILKFDLPEEQEEFDCAINGTKWQASMQNLDNYLRNELKYKDAGEDYEKIREELHSILLSYNLEV